MSDAAVLICEHEKIISARVISDRTPQVEAIKWVAEDARRTDRIEVVNTEVVRATIEMCRPCANEADDGQ